MSLPPNSTEMKVGCCPSAALTCVAPDGSTRLYQGALAGAFSGVFVTASIVSAPAMPRSWVGSVTPATFSAQTVLPAADSPLRRLPLPSGATSGEVHPGDWIRGRLIGLSVPKPSSAGHDPSCEPAYTPFDAQPMLMLVPMATYFWSERPPPSRKATREGRSSVCGDVGMGASEQAPANAAAPRRKRDCLMAVSVRSWG